MAWVELEYSKKAVRRAGDYLIQDLEDIDFGKFVDSYTILNNWRSSHAYPLQSMLGYFRKKAFEIDNSAIVARRLKRTPSILAKLRREEGMKLDRMEDIGGCRIVVSDQRKVFKVRDAIVGGRTRNILRRERDYIRNPKSSGYRGIHLVYKYNGQKREYSGHSVDLQVRSNIQHSWATAVEVVGTFTGQALKASQGHNAWLNFFKYASIAFEDIEKGLLHKNVASKNRRELIKYIDRLGVLPRLRAFAVTTRQIGKKKKKESEYFLLVLEIDKSNIRVFRYPEEYIATATNQYAEFEKEFKDNDNKDVVLVSAESIHSLRKAYPNYFADTTEFSNNLNKVINASNSLLRTL